MSPVAEAALPGRGGSDAGSARKREGLAWNLSLQLRAQKKYSTPFHRAEREPAGSTVIPQTGSRTPAASSS